MKCLSSSLDENEPLNDDVDVEDDEAKTEEENLPPSSTTTTDESLFGDGDAHLMLLYVRQRKEAFRMLHLHGKIPRLRCT